MQSFQGKDPFYELSTVCVLSVYDAFFGCDNEKFSTSELETEPGAALTINWKGPSILSLKVANAPDALNEFDADHVLKHLSLQLQAGCFPSVTGRVVGNLPNGGFVSILRAPNSDTIQHPICFFISKPCFISSRALGIALISVPHECVTPLLPPGTSILPLTICIIARKTSGARRCFQL
jgi:hypothetical protein